MSRKYIEVLGGDWPRGKARMETLPWPRRLYYLSISKGWPLREKIQPAEIVSVETRETSGTSVQQQGLGQIGSMALGLEAFGGLGLLAGTAVGRNKQLSKSRMTAVLRVRDGRQAFIEGDYDVLKLLIAAAFDNEAANRRAAKQSDKPLPPNSPRLPFAKSDSGMCLSKHSAAPAARFRTATPPLAPPTPTSMLGGLFVVGTPVVLFGTWIFLGSFGYALLLAGSSLLAGIVVVIAGQRSAPIPPQHAESLPRLIRSQDDPNGSPVGPATPSATGSNL